MTRRRDDDDGFSLTEMLVAMGLLGVVGAVFTGAILSVYRTTARTEQVSSAQSELQRTFQSFDKSLRYATWIAEPGQVGTAWYVEFADLNDAGAARCRQLRLETSTGVLQLISWVPGKPPAAGVAGQTIASQVITPTAPPFLRQAAGSAPTVVASGDVGSAFITEFQRLRIRLTTQVATSTAQIDSTFTAANTSRTTPVANACSDGRPR